MLQLKFLGRFSDLGFLILRLVVGGSFVMHGFPKISAGPEQWVMLANLTGITQMPAFFGFLAAFAEFGGGICLVLGFMTRPACILMLGTMLGALHYHIPKGDAFQAYSHALEMAGVFAGLIFMGPGRLSIDRG